MNPQETFQPLAESADPTAELGRIARQLGYMLVNAPLQAVRDFRAEAAEARDLPERDRLEKAFEKGVLFALCEVAAGFDAELREKQERQQLTAWAGDRPLHGALLLNLQGNASYPKDLAARVERDFGQVSRALKDLVQAGLVERMETGREGDQRKRPYRLTQEGLRLVIVSRLTSEQSSKAMKPARTRAAGAKSRARESAMAARPAAKRVVVPSR